MTDVVFIFTGFVEPASLPQEQLVWPLLYRTVQVLLKSSMFDLSFYLWILLSLCICFNSETFLGRFFSLCFCVAV